MSLIKNIEDGEPLYTCPLCRKPITTLPTENFAVKKIIQALAEENGSGTLNKAQASRIDSFTSFFDH